MTNWNATETGNGYPLKPIPDCYIDTGENGKIEFYSLPNITDGKSASYPEVQIMGRSAPLVTYSSSSSRTISLTFHLYVTRKSDIQKNNEIIKKIIALVHPEYDNTYLPPRIAKIKCGKFLGGQQTDGVPVLLQNYSIQYDTETQWFEDGGIYMPLQQQITTSWLVVYTWSNVPGHKDVIAGNY